MTNKDGRYCDRCGCLLTKENNKCGFDICDKCNDRLEQFVQRKMKEGMKNG